MATLIGDVEIKKMFEGVCGEWRKIILQRLRKEFEAALQQVAASPVAITPKPEDILAAFRHCDFKNLKVVLIGQDPYSTPGHANGLSFGVARGVTVPRSLRGIYEALVFSGLLKCAPTHGDLTEIAKQGVLLLNAALTTEVGKSNAHAAIWKPFVTALIPYIPAGTPFIILGSASESLMRGLATTRFRWGHPSPLNRDNSDVNNPKHFRYCPCFKDVNKYLVDRGTSPIDWSCLLKGDELEAPEVTVPKISVLDEILEGVESSTAPAASTSAAPIASTSAAAASTSTAPLSPSEQLLTRIEVRGNSVTRIAAPKFAEYPHLFVDGACRGNGKADCQASWAVVVLDKNGETLHQDYGIVPAAKNMPATNNRGEIMALLKALEYVKTNIIGRAVIVGDSVYALSAVTAWAKRWKRENDTTKKNTDLCFPASDLFEELKARLDINHVRSHENKPEDEKSYEYYCWRGNDLVDRLAASVIV